MGADDSGAVLSVAGSMGPAGAVRFRFECFEMVNPSSSEAASDGASCERARRSGGAGGGRDS